MEITTSDFFINMKRVPDAGSSEYKAFWREEKRKAYKDGVIVDGIFIPPWLYWHLNFWKVWLDFEEDGRIVQKYGNPILRDNEWLLANAIHEAEMKRKGLVVMGIRRFAKSVIASSYIAQGATFDRGSENVLAGLNADDIKLITEKIDPGLTSLPDPWRFERIEDNWNKQVTLGNKDEKGVRIPWSMIKIRNFDGGKNEEAIAGTKPRRLLIDEIGKGRFLRGFQAAEPGFTTKFGWGCSPILTGTGGEIESLIDSKTLFFDPESYNFLVFKNEKTGRSHGLYISCKYRQEAKEPSSLGAFLDKPAGSDLHHLYMEVSNEDKAMGITLRNRELKRRSNDPKAYPKEVMYFPVEVDDIFMNDKNNPFPLDAVKQQVEYLKANNITGQYVRLFRNTDGTAGWRSADAHDMPIKEWPVRKDTNKDAPVVMFQPPVENAPDGLYIAGSDPYHQNESENSESLGTLYIYKRLSNDTDGSYHDEIVAVYAARPRTQKEWFETAELLMDLYKARCMPENENTSFIQYFDNRNKGYMLADGFQLHKEIHPTTSIKGRIKGLPATVKVINYCMDLLVQYCIEELVIGYDNEGKPIKRLGVTRIKDPMLLEEMLGYGADANVDRIVAMRHVLAYDKFLVKFDPVVNMTEEKEQKKQQPAIRSPFSGVGTGGYRINTPFSGTNRCLNRR